MAISAGSTAPDLRQGLAEIFTAALRAVDGAAAVRRHVAAAGDTLHIGKQAYDLTQIERIFVVGGGKASALMANALYELLGARVTGGVVNVKYGHAARPGGWQVRLGAPAALAPAVSAPIETGPIKIIEAGHPVPDAAGLAGAQRIVALLAGLTVRDLVVVVLSGGGSALLALPAPPLTLADYQALTRSLLRSGAQITEVNAVRKHCAQLGGGQLARLAAPAQVAALILSDVVGSPLDAIASGPTAPDSSTFAHAWSILVRYGITDEIPASIRAHLRRGMAGALPDTPKAGDPLFERVNNVLVGDNFSAGLAAAQAGRALGFDSRLLTTAVQGEAREVGRVLAGLGQGIALGQSELTPPACLVFGGETTVTLRGTGRGGRNQELALAAGLALAASPLPAGRQVAVASLGTDGSDGPTDAAGGVGWADTVARASAAGLDIHAALANNDSYPVLAALGDLVVTGPTQTNVNDLMLVLVT